METCLLNLELPGLAKVRSGKVREVFDLGDRLLFVATDRISAFDCILPNGIPGKGCILNQLSAWWFRYFHDAIPHHLIEDNADRFPPELAPHRRQLSGRSMIVRKTRVLPIECVARGYLIGSGWKEYQDRGDVCGVPLPPGLRLADRLDQPIFTPAAKADTGHDENIDFNQVVQEVGAALAHQLRDHTLDLYRKAAAYALTRGILLADTKFEFGIDDKGKLLLIDEALTPDSSRYWPADLYRPGHSPPSYDKQIVRDYLDQLDWDKRPPAPELPLNVVEQTRDRYGDLFERITGSPPSTS